MTLDFSEKNGWSGLSGVFSKVSMFYNISSNYKLVSLDEGTSLYKGMHIVKLCSRCTKLFISNIIKGIFLLTLVKVDAPGQSRASFNS